VRVIPDSGTLKLILSLAEEVFRKTVGPGDGFVALGGDSLAAVQFSILIENALEREIDIAWIFDADTFHELSVLIDT
jgi:acyl carrier protein